MEKCNYKKDTWCDHCEDRFKCFTQMIDFEPIPDFGDIMLMDEFVECCEHGSLIDYDGYAQYSNGKEIALRLFVYPSEKADQHWTHVVWYNK